MHPLDLLSARAKVHRDGITDHDQEEGSVEFGPVKVLAIRDPYITPEMRTSELLPTRGQVCMALDDSMAGESDVVPVVQEVVLDHQNVDENATVRAIDRVAHRQLQRIRALHARQVQEVEADHRRVTKTRAEAEACEWAYADMRRRLNLPPRAAGARIPQATNTVEVTRKSIGLRPLPTDLPMPAGSWAAGTHSKEAQRYYEQLQQEKEKS